MISDEPSRIELLLESLDRLPSADHVFQLASSGPLMTVTHGASSRDDCASIDVSGDFTLVFGSDYVRGSRFLLYELGHLSNFDIGYYLAGANLSDIAAMGAKPVALTSVIRYPSELSDDQFLQVVDGIASACHAAGCLNVGGDIGSAERIILSGSAIGMVERGRQLHRSGASPGDLLVLGGTTGVASAAMRYFVAVDNGDVEPDEGLGSQLLAPWRRVNPQFDFGRSLVETGAGTACIDTSDGLRSSIEQLAAASGVGARVDLSQVPIDEAVAAAAEALGCDPIEIVFEGSVDFRLLATVSPAQKDQLPAGATVIGEITNPEAGIVLEDGPTNRSLPGTPWRHQDDLGTAFTPRNRDR